MAFENGAPRDEGEFAALLDEGVFAAGKFDGAAKRAFHQLARAGLDIGEAKLVGELAANADKLALAEGHQHAGAIDDPILFLVSEALGDQPLPTARLGFTYLPAETGIARRLRLANTGNISQVCCSTLCCAPATLLEWSTIRQNPGGAAHA